MVVKIALALEIGCSGLQGGQNCLGQFRFNALRERNSLVPVKLRRFCRPPSPQSGRREELKLLLRPFSWGIWTIFSFFVSVLLLLLPCC
jgi:hypothetical protein